MVRFGLALMVATLSMASAHATDTVLLHAAGSLRGALTEISRAFQQQHGTAVTQRYAPSGLLRDAIQGGEKSEVFASANMSHPQSLAKAGKAGPVVLFARNELCAFIRPGLSITTSNLLDRMLDPAIKLGTSTPKADPAGDYAFQVFARADAIRAGSKAALEAKALQLTGGPTSRQPQAGRNLYGDLLAEGAADIFLAYCTNEGPISKEQPAIGMVRLPETLAVGADYGLALVNGASIKAAGLVMFILSPDGQRLLAKHGFTAPGLPRENP
ncbi:MAG: molybdate ABC transporter substrate-binding protein [Methylobacterium sp.]|nr:molybdate ABC transporter substrate-binding protein [Methylobacterium sp.]